MKELQRSGGDVMGSCFVLLYAVVALSPLLLVAVLWMKGEMTLMHETGTSFAFAAYGIIALQPVLVARWKWTERPFGLDVMARFHKYMGMFAAGLLILHPPLMAYGGAGSGLLFGFDQPWYIWIGKATLVLLLIQVVVSIGYRSLGYTFETWRRTHNVLAVLMISAAFVHSSWAGYDMGPIPMRVLWFVLLGITAYAYLGHKVWQPARLSRHPYSVVGVEQETHNVWTIKLAPPEGKRIYEYHPGQFHFITFHRSPDLPVEEHHWTISSSPAQRDFIRSTIKASGDFTGTISKTRVGDTAVLEGPFGRFSYTFNPEDKDFVFIAGGIGITPFMSMLRHMRDTANAADVLLIFANRTEKDIAFRSELEQIEAGAKPRLKVVHILTSPDSHWTGESGHLDREKLVRLLGPEAGARVYYVCAPPPMTESVIQDLRSMRVPYSRMRTEEFSL
jgi:predicted ferric reductase